MRRRATHEPGFAYAAPGPAPGAFATRGDVGANANAPRPGPGLMPFDDGRGNTRRRGGVFASAHPGAPEECWDLVPYMAAWSGRTEQQLCAATLGELAEFLEAIGADPWTPHEPNATIADVCGSRCGLAGAGTCGNELGPKCSATKALGQAAYDARECADTTREDVRGKSCTCLLYTSPSPRDRSLARMPSSA